MPSTVPRLPDSTLAFRREPYTFISTQCDRFGSDLFATRLALRPVVCLRGAEAAAAFYDPGRFGRRRAIPRSVQHLLQDEGSVQTLTGRAHDHRKRLFLEQLTGPSVERLSGHFARLFEDALGRDDRRRIVLDRELRPVLTEAALLWAGLGARTGTVQRRAEEFGLMVDRAAAFGPVNWNARRRRRHTERWAAEQIRRLRAPGSAEGLGAADDAGPAAAVARHLDERGRLLPEDIAAVELLNLLRPIVAVSRFMTFAAVALIQNPRWRDRLRGGDAEDAHLFAQEVRRYYPYFPLVGGTARHPFDWKGHHFGTGDLALLDLYGTNHDRRLWEDPQSFAPERFLARPPGASDLVPQGGGDMATGHRCPGEDATLSLIAAAARVLADRPRLTAVAQDLTIDLSRVPAGPRSGVVLDAVRP